MTISWKISWDFDTFALGDYGAFYPLLFIYVLRQFGIVPPQLRPGLHIADRHGIRHKRSVKILSKKCPFPFMLILIPAADKRSVNASLVNWQPWSLLQSRARHSRQPALTMHGNTGMAGFQGGTPFVHDRFTTVAWPPVGSENGFAISIRKSIITLAKLEFYEKAF